MPKEKKLNLELKDYIKRLAVESLESCEVFRKVYGRRFVSRKFDKNVDKVYSDEVSTDKAGYYNIEKGNITICYSGKKGERLTQQEIEKDENLKATCVHEVIHAILKRDKRKLKGLKRATGMQETTKDGYELGRGLNEGLTEWICDVAGLQANGYKELTNIIKQLEIALGTKKVMQLGKGGIEKNIPNILRMTNVECETFLGLGDQAYSLGEYYQFFYKLPSTLEGKMDSESLEKIKKDSRMKLILGSKNYQKAIFMKGEEREREVLLELAKEKAESLKDNKRKTFLSMESIIFDKYFKKEFEQIQEEGKISESQLYKFNQLSRLMHKDLQNEDEKDYSSIKFQNTFQKIKSKYLKSIYKRAGNELYEGKLTSQQLEYYVQKTLELNGQSGYIILKDIAYKMNPNYFREISSLLIQLHKKGELNEINKYSIQIARANDREEPILYKDGILAQGVHIQAANERKDKQEDMREYFDFTLREDEKFQDIVANFLKLRNQIEENDPKAKIHIVNRVIVVEGLEGRQIYMIENGQIMQAEEVKNVETKYTISKGNENLPVPAKKRWIDKIKDRLFKRKMPTEQIEEQEERKNEFKARISNMSNYSNYQVGGNQEKTIENNRQDTDKNAR